MKTLTHKLALILFAVLLANCGSDSEDDQLPIDDNQIQWEETAPFPGYIRKEGTGFWIDDKFFTGFGFGYLDENYQTLDNLNDFYEYNSTTNTWTKKADFPGLGRLGIVSFSMNGKGYVGFGKSLVNCNPACTHVHYNDLWEFNPELNSWSLIDTYNQIPEGETPFARSYVIGTKVYLTFGYDLWVFDSVGKTLTKVGPVPEAMIFSTGFVLNGKIFIGTGGVPDMLTAFYEFNPSTETWTKKANLAGPARR